MKKLNKKWIIIAISLLVVIIMASMFIIKNKQQEKDNNQQTQTQENTYEALVSINPLIKLEFKEVCHKSTESENSKTYSCDAPKVTNYELINDDAKNIYSDLDFSSTGGGLADVLVMLAKKARENGIVFDSVQVSSNWENLEEYKNNNESLNVYNFEISIINKEELEKEENQKFLVTFNSDGGSSVDSQEILKGNKVSAPISPTKEGYSFVEWKLNGETYDFDNKIKSNIELKAVWKKLSVSNNQNNKPTGNNSSSNNQNNKPASDNSSSNNQNNTNDNSSSKNEDNNIPKEEIIEQPKPAYDLNLNDNIMYSYISVPIYAKLSSTCIEQFQEAGYKIHNGELVAIEFEADKDADYYGDLREKFPSCFNPVPQSTVNKLKNTKGVNKNEASNDYFLAVWFNEPEYRKYDALNYIDANKYGIMSYGGMGYNDFTLLTEEACQEYNLSCGRW